jgi:hypothetical protein
VGHRVARALLNDVVASLPGERLQLSKQLRAAPLCLLGGGGPDEVEVEVDREPREVGMEQVERRAATQREFVAEALADLAEQLGETEDGLEWGGAEAALACDAREVAAVGECVHVASRGAGRKWAGTITFQRLTSFPPRTPGSR